MPTNFILCADTANTVKYVHHTMRYCMTSTTRQLIFNNNNAHTRHCALPQLDECSITIRPFIDTKTSYYSYCHNVHRLLSQLQEIGWCQMYYYPKGGGSFSGRLKAKKRFPSGIILFQKTHINVILKKKKYIILKKFRASREGPAGPDGPPRCSNVPTHNVQIRCWLMTLESKQKTNLMECLKYKCKHLVNNKP